MRNPFKSSVPPPLIEIRPGVLVPEDFQKKKNYPHGYPEFQAVTGPSPRVLRQMQTEGYRANRRRSPEPGIPAWLMAEGRRNGGFTIPRHRLSPQVLLEHEEAERLELEEDERRRSMRRQSRAPSMLSGAGPSHTGSGRGSRFQQDPFSAAGPVASYHSSAGGFDQDPPYDDVPSHLSSRLSNAPTTPQVHSARSHATPPAPRTGKIREGDPLPAGVSDPLATSAAAVPKGHHGLRKHKPGMTNLHVGGETSADNPAGKWKLLEALMETTREDDGGGGRSGRGHGGGRKR